MTDDGKERGFRRRVGSTRRVVCAVDGAFGGNADLPSCHRHTWRDRRETQAAIGGVINKREKRMREISDTGAIKLHDSCGSLFVQEALVRPKSVRHAEPVQRIHGNNDPSDYLSI